MSSLTSWANFYVVVGTSAGALTGLTFIVITLFPGFRTQGDEGQGIAAFTTPTVVHFGMVLFVSAVLSAPWPALSPAAVLLGLTGLAGVLYIVIVMRRQRRMARMELYTPVLEDWLRYVVCPFVAYAAFLVAAILLPGSSVAALFIIGGALLLLLFLAISNAWDIVTYIAIQRFAPQTEGNEQNERKE